MTGACNCSAGFFGPRCTHGKCVHVAGMCVCVCVCDIVVDCTLSTQCMHCIAHEVDLT